MWELSLLVPLGAIGVLRWLSWLIRRTPAVLYEPVENDHRERLSIVVPVYQEDPQQFRYALTSWVNSGATEVICVIDVTDRRSIEIAHEFGVTVIETDVPGKRDALRKGWEHATTPLVALVDSDTIWDFRVAKEVCKPFADPSVGGVGTRQNVDRPTTMWQHLNDMYLDYRYFDEIAAQTVAGQAISCLSGRTAVYRRELLLEISDEFMEETFLGVPCMSGDDKRLTTLVLERGYRTVMQRSARVWSSFPDDAATFFKQRLRWARNTWRSDLRALTSGWLWRRCRFLAFAMLDKAISAFTIFLAPAFMIYALVTARWILAAFLAIWWLVSRSAKMLPHLERKPHHALTMMPFFILMSFAMACVKLAALFTIRKQRWMTRDVAVSARTGQVLRTAPANEPASVEAA
ncbi:MAG: glycosyltransferase [Nitriliruptorales bacterium]|nr:glycosyltransferase [Nitriliruptorales bacterium]